MKSFVFPLHFLLLSLLVGCALVKNSENKVVELTPEQEEKLNREALAIASERLEQMVSQAKNNSQETVNFLATDLFLKGNMSLMEGDYLTASVLFKHVVALHPNDQFVQKKYAISLIRVGDLETAQGVLEKLYKDTKDDKVGLILAGVYTGIDKEEKAREVYVQILKADPKNEDACVFLGKSYAVDKQVEKAVKQLSQCASMDPKNGIYDYYVGKMYIDLGKIPQAIESFKKAHARQPELTQAVNALGVIYEEREQFEAAIKLYEGHLKRRPNDTTILAKVVQVLFLKERYAEVIPYAEKLSDLEPDNLNLKVKLGVLYTDAKKYPEAVSVFKDLLASAPGSDKILYYLGAIYQEMNQYPEAIEYFNQVQPESGLYADSSVQMANMLSTLAQVEFHEDKKETKWKDAFLALVNKKTEELKDMRVEFSVIKAGFYEGTSQFKEAMQTMMVVQDEKDFSLQHKYYLANLYEKEKKFEESTSLIMGILENEPKNAHAWNFLGYSLLTREQEMDRAYEYIQKALKISPDDGYIRDSLGWYYYKKGDIKRALVELDYAVKKIPDDVEILKHLAVIHKEMKNYAKAKSFFESALRYARYPYDKKEIISSMETLETERVPASGKID